MWWQKVESIVLRKYKTFSNLRVIEIGGGIMPWSILMAKRGARVTILDYSETALEKSRECFERVGVAAEGYLKCDALQLPEGLIGQYDISMSMGVAEHFLGEERKIINMAHFDLIKSGGLTFITVPCKGCTPYLLYMFLAKRTNKWHAGDEWPYSRRELLEIAGSLGFENCLVFGAGSFLQSWIGWIKKICVTFVPGYYRLEKYIKGYTYILKDKNEFCEKKITESILDSYLSYAIVLHGEK